MAGTPFYRRSSINILDDRQAISGDIKRHNRATSDVAKRAAARLLSIDTFE